MKKSILTIAASVVAVGAFAQGTVNFQNITGTGAGNVAAITNSIGGARVVSGTTFLVALYGGASGTAASALQLIGSAVNFTQPGFFAGGTRNLDASVVGDATAGARQASLQVRAWQASLGATWEAALAEANKLTHPQEVLGASSVITITTGNPLAMPPGTPANLAGLKGFVLTPVVPEPSTIGLAGLGLAALAMLRRRK